MKNKEIARTVKNLYHQFCREHGVTPGTIYANILWQWPGYLQAHKTW